MASPAPAVAGGQGPGQALDMVKQIVSASRMLGQMIPGAIPIVRQINDLIQQLQSKIVQTGPAAEAQAPPV